MPAELIALVYRQRYTVELFFRFLKQLLQMRHLISHRPRGAEIEVYCAVMVCLLIQLQTGRRPRKRTVEMLAWHALGIASEQEVMEHLAKLQRKAAAKAQACMPQA